MLIFFLYSVNSVMKVKILTADVIPTDVTQLSLFITLSILLNVFLLNYGL